MNRTKSRCRLLANLIDTYRGKFMLLAFLISVVPMGIVTVFAYLNFRQDIFSKVIDANSELLSIVDWNIETIARDANEIADFMITSDLVQRNLRQPLGTVHEEFLLDRTIRQMMTNITYSKSFIDRIYVHTELRDYLQLDEMLLGSDSAGIFRTISTGAYDDIVNLKGRGYWFKTGLPLDSEPHIVYGRLIRDIKSLDTIGVLLISMRETIFDDMFRRIIEGDTTRLAFIDRDNRIVYETPVDEDAGSASQLISRLSEPLPQESFFIETINNERYIFTAARNASTGWKLIAFSQYGVVLREVFAITKLTLWVAGVSLLCAMTAAFFMSNSITKQLTKLRGVLARLTHSERIDDVSFDDADEVGAVGNEFMRIVRWNKELNTNLYQAVLKEREAELAALQSQINPHFLYNTLDTIYWMAFNRRQQDIAVMILSLSNMFKLSLNTESKFATIREELEQVENYMHIQSIRFKNRIVYKKDIDPALLERRIIKFILQPIVENSVYHGLEPKEGTGAVSISVQDEPECYVFIVEDDGVGFHEPPVTEKHRGHGLKNVSERIRLYYGNAYGITVHSRTEGGTKVIVRLGKSVAEDESPPVT